MVGGRYILRINSQLPFYAAVETLLHEYAHALDGRKYSSDAESHGPIWGVWYAACYRVMLQWDDDWKATNL